MILPSNCARFAAHPFHFLLSLPLECGTDMPTDGTGYRNWRVNSPPKIQYWEFPDGPVVRAQGPGSIPGPGTKILQAVWGCQKKKNPLFKFVPISSLSMAPGSNWQNLLWKRNSWK